MEELEKMSEKLEALFDALSEVMYINPESSPIYKKCKEMRSYIASCIQYVTDEIDKLIDAGTV